MLEILIVLTIIALIATLVGPRLMSALDRSKSTTASVQIRSLRAALDTMRLDLGRYPTAEEGLNALVAPPGDAPEWQGPYLDTELPNDPWGRPYLYEPSDNPDVPPRIGSYGSDGRPGGSGSAEDVFSANAPSP